MPGRFVGYAQPCEQSHTSRYAYEMNTTPSTVRVKAQVVEISHVVS